MIYGVEFRDYLKGSTNILLFKDRTMARWVDNIFYDLWDREDKVIEEGSDHFLYQLAFDKAIGIIEEINRNDVEEVMKKVEVDVYIDGKLTTVLSNIKVVNFGNSTYIPC